MRDHLDSLANMIRARAASDGCHATAIPALSLYRYTQTAIQMPEAGAPYLYLLAAGSMRLLSIRDEPVQLAYTGRHIKREIIFQALCGSCGRQFLQSMISIQAAEEIYAVNAWIKRNFRKAFSVEELAEQRNMSVSAFHQKFKSAVGMGPLQCRKRLRLTEAWRLMLDENFSVTDAALEVGYESVSQFIRDYRKMFSAPLKEDVQGLRRQLKTGASSGCSGRRP